MPIGRVVELFGKNGSGKTTLAMQIAERYTDK
ncbi:MAG: ATP-binding cassette domain-containing protein [Gammaproteobacteria bacterium]|nr:ATP-binding cassette domain-containing protein [Gammaproteobacteria bacterium]